jgi:hypothetical protein
VTESKLTKSQYKHFGPRPIEGYGPGAAITATVRFDDECGNGHNTFAITADIRVPERRDVVACGCLHDDVKKAFPELAKYIKWHLCSTNGPLHYIQNTLYLAGNKDCWGRAPGEPSAWELGVRFGDSPVTHHVNAKFWRFIKERYGTTTFRVVGYTHERDPDTYGTHHTLEGFGAKWHECPFRHKREADEFCEGLNRCKVEFIKVPVEYSEGKPRELEAARRAAVWPEATDEELTSPDLKERLLARLPGLLEAFRANVEELGLTW